jgi:hypothetical protein
VDSHLRGEAKGIPLTKHEHDLLYQRAIEGSRKDAARAAGQNYSSVHHTMASIFAKLDVEDLVSAFWAMGWLNPLPYGVSKADVRHEQLQEGNHTEQDFWKRMDDATKDLEGE